MLPFVSKILWKSGRLVSLVSWQLLKFTVTQIRGVSGIVSFIGYTNTAALSLFMLLTFASIHVRAGRDIDSPLMDLDENSAQENVRIQDSSVLLAISLVSFSTYPKQQLF